MSKKYNPKGTEDKWYKHWMEKNYFHSEPDEREAYSIVIPPPNVTGVLHMGHMLNNTIQDILIRKARLEGKNACWVPGTDHASIATEAKVVKLLREQGIKKSDIGREAFLKHAFDWKDKYGGIILDQLKKLGASCDWERTAFTMDKSLSKAVIQIFNDLYKKGKIYRGLRMTNWDPEAKTVLSNEEVIFKDENSRLHYVRYQVEGTTDEWVTIATVRPETILGDTAVAVHPEDERFAHLKGKRVIVPMVNRSIPIIFDKYVEMDFGTGCLKVTPAHDMNDHEIGERHNLEVIDVLNDDATMSEAAQFYVGMDCFKARKAIVKDLEEMGHIVKIEDYRNKVGRSERTDAIVEPRLTLQWFLDMKDFSATALKAVEDGEVKFYPDHFQNMYHNWLNEDNVRDWCISRQLWWGQQIPAWYHEDEIYVAETPEDALAQAQEKTGNTALTIDDLKRDEDVVDTWFSSWLWPISVFNGFENQKELKYYYPTNVLVTGWDIIYLWVARMIMAGYEWSPELLGKETAVAKGVQPFKDVYFTGMVRDSKRRKMSKSLGNSPDALKLIENYGADGVRFGMLFSGSAGNDIIFDAPIDPKTKKALNESALCSQGTKFCNKIFNAHGLVKLFKIEDNIDANQLAVNQLATTWFENKFNQLLAEIEQKYQTYRLSDVLETLYNFIWNDFFSWYLEMTKSKNGYVMDKATYEKTLSFFEQLMTVLHPFMPFITEEVWHQLRDRADGEDCVVSTYPTAADFDKKAIDTVEAAKDIISNVRDIRNKNGISPKEALKVFIQNSDTSKSLFAINGIQEMVVKIANLESIEFTNDEPENTVSFISGTDKFFVEINQEIDVEAEIEALEKEEKRLQGFVGGISKKLSNERFVANAPEVVVAKERQKLTDGQARLTIVQSELTKLKG